MPTPSPLLAELASAAAEAEALNAETFTFEGTDYLGVLSDAPVGLSLAVAGYGETASKMLQASLAQFDDATLTRFSAVPLEARLIVTARGRTWKVVSVENDGIHVKFGINNAGT